MSYQRGTVLVFVVLAVGLIAGCGGSSEDSGAAATLESAAETAEETVEAVADAASDAASDAAAEVGEAVDDASQASADLEEKIAKTEAELQKVADELKELSTTDLMGDKAKDLKSRQEKLMEELEALKGKM